jgi:hypothetical protein
VPEIPAELADLIDVTLASAMDTVTEVGVPFLAFAMTDTADGRGLHRFMTDRIEESASHAQQFAATHPDAARVAFAMDGYLPHEDRKWDAVIVEGWDHVNGLRVTVAQRYRLDAAGTTGQPVGAPLMLAAEEIAPR